MPVEHDVQAETPPELSFPALQSVHAVRPAVPPKVPPGHEAHALTPVVRQLNVLTPQAVQTEEAGVRE